MAILIEKQAVDHNGQQQPAQPTPTEMVASARQQPSLCNHDRYDLPQEDTVQPESIDMKKHTGQKT